MCAYGENWCPSETVRLVARIILKQVRTTYFFGMTEYLCFHNWIDIKLNILFQKVLIRNISNSDVTTFFSSNAFFISALLQLTTTILIALGNSNGTALKSLLGKCLCTCTKRYFYYT